MPPTMATAPKKPEGLRATDAVIGIDLGMTSVVAAHVPQGQPPQVIPGERGATALPAVVGFRSAKETVVGRAAQEMLTTAPERTVTGVKRLLGRKITSQAVKDLAARVGFKIVEGTDQDVTIQVDDRRISPVEVASLVLAQARALAEAHLKTTVAHCVVAVPAYFNDAQKTAVREAAKRAGMEAVKLVHEPTAVALAYGFNKGGDARIVILDMGGIRLDVSVMEITGNVFDVVATGGDAYLGGLVLDARIAEWILANIKKKYGKDLGGRARAAHQGAHGGRAGQARAVQVQGGGPADPLNVVPKGTKRRSGRCDSTRRRSRSWPPISWTASSR
jgi:molecular chaperone DnaK